VEMEECFGAGGSRKRSVVNGYGSEA
jgi:hypothetical protein